MNVVNNNDFIFTIKMEVRLFENDKTELKSVLNDKLEKSVVAFLNSKTGGDIFIGVTNDGTAVGVENIDKSILAVADRTVFNLSEKFLEVVFPFEEEYLNGKVSAVKDKTDQVTPPVTDQVTNQVKQVIMAIKDNEKSAKEIMFQLALHHNHNFRINFLIPAIQLGLVELTIPEKPNSRLQKYRLTNTGQAIKKTLAKSNRKLK